ncbi:MAG: inorganic phosphate transporter [Pararhizobium sp.]
MARTTVEALKPTLDKDLDKLSYVEEAAGFVSRSLVAPGIALVFVAVVVVFAASFVTASSNAVIIGAAGAIGAYMALNIGANDVANNVGPAVGSKALSMGGALIIAAIFETLGALVAGSDVVDTISSGIVDPANVADPQIFVWVMMAALVSSALWVNVATWFGAPVSTTHAVVGGVTGAGIAAVGLSAVHWSVIGSITASWIVSPLIGGIFAAACLAFVKTFIIYQDDKIAAARRWVPILIALMSGAFAAYLMMKAVAHFTPVSLADACIAGLVFGVVTWLVCRPLIRHQSKGLENRNQSLRKLFTIPLVFSAALLSFAHGANDVANAVGPLAAIVSATEAGRVGNSVSIPLWVMVVGAFGISLGLMLFGPKLIRMVGQQITRLNPMRAYCVALSAAVTVIFASWLGLPVSSTHIAVGAVFGVGFFREWYTGRSKRRAAYIRRNAKRHRRRPPKIGAHEEVRRRKLVRRSHFMTVIAAWVVTVPASAGLSAVVYLILHALFV